MANKPTYGIIDATVNHTEERFRGLAAKYLDWRVRSLGGEIVSPCEADFVLATVVSPHEWECLPRALKRFGVNRPRQKVILGGQGALSPAIFDPFVDVSCVGEGDNFLKTLLLNGYDFALQLPCSWIPGDTREVIPDDDFPWDAPPVMGEDRVVHIFASRGCHKKCLFCHTGWSVNYRENDDVDSLLRQHRRLVNSGYRVNVVTNDAPALSFFDSIEKVEHFSASYSQLLELMNGDIRKIVKKVKSVRIGVEAPSYRLRKIIGKPIPKIGLEDLTFELLNHGIGVRWFMIAGLPGETNADWDELKETVILARHRARKGALQLSFTAFCPDSSAPLCLAQLDDSYFDRFSAFWHWFFDGPGFTRRVQLFKCAGPQSRLRHAIGSMAANEARLRRGWDDIDPPNWRIRYAYRDVARKAYNIYARRVGLLDEPVILD
jgi:hypothetical protein